MSDDSAGTPIGFRYNEQYTPPKPERVSDVALITHSHVFEVDPRLMERWVLQQTFPNWDSLRIINSRHEYLEWMRRHFASTVLTGSELLAEVQAEDVRTHELTQSIQKESPGPRRPNASHTTQRGQPK